MNYNLLFINKSADDLREIARVWRHRYDQLIEKYGAPVDQMENKKAERLIFQLIDRISTVAAAYSYLATGKEIPDFPKAAIPLGVSVNPDTLELIITYPPEHVTPEQRN